MSLGSARAWQSLGEGLTSLGARLDQKQQDDEVKARQKIEDDRRYAAQQEETRLRREQEGLDLAKMGGGFGTAPTDMEPITGTGMQPPAPAPHPLFTPTPAVRSPLGLGASDTGEQPPSMFRGQGIGMDQTPPAAPAIAAPEITQPIMHDANAGRFRQINDNAYITDPRVMQKEEQDTADQRALDLERQKTDIKLGGIGKRLAALHPGMTPDQQDAEAGLMAYGDVPYAALHPKAPPEPGLSPTAVFEERRARAMAAAGAIAQIVNGTYYNPGDATSQAQIRQVLATYGYASQADIAADLTQQGETPAGRGKGGAAPPRPPVVPPGPGAAAARGATAGYEDSPLLSSIIQRTGVGDGPAPSPAPAVRPARPAAPTPGKPFAATLGTPADAGISDAGASAIAARLAGKPRAEAQQILERAGASPAEIQRILGGGG